MLSGNIVLFLSLTSFAWTQESSPYKQNRHWDELIESLGHPDPQVRDHGHEELRNLGPEVEVLLRKNLLHPDPEIVTRCKSLLAALESTKIPVQKVFRARVVYKDLRENWVLIDLPAQEILKPGLHFDIYRNRGAGQNYLHIAVAEFTSNAGADHLSKLRIILGNVADIMDDDDVLAKITIRVYPSKNTCERASVIIPILQPQPILVLGKIAIADAARGMIATDVRFRDGVKAGERFQVYRAGQYVGSLIVSDVQKWGSWVTPEGKWKIWNFQKGDRIEWRPEE